MQLKLSKSIVGFSVVCCQLYYFTSRFSQFSIVIRHGNAYLHGIYVCDKCYKYELVTVCFGFVI